MTRKKDEVMEALDRCLKRRGLWKGKKGFGNYGVRPKKTKTTQEKCPSSGQ